MTDISLRSTWSCFSFYNETPKNVGTLKAELSVQIIWTLYLWYSLYSTNALLIHPYSKDTQFVWEGYFKNNGVILYGAAALGILDMVLSQVIGPKKCLLNIIYVRIFFSVVTSQLISLHDHTAYNSMEIAWNSEACDSHLLASLHVGLHWAHSGD